MRLMIMAQDANRRSRGLKRSSLKFEVEAESWRKRGKSMTRFCATPVKGIARTEEAYMPRISPGIYLFP